MTAVSANRDPAFCPGPTLVGLIAGSFNGTLFHHWYTTDDQQQLQDSVEGGEKSCALYVSILLQICGLLDGVYLDIDPLIEALEANGWARGSGGMITSSIEVAVWGDEVGNRHIGFAFAASPMAVSHSSFEGAPRRHPRTLRDGREIARRFTHPQLTNLEKDLRLSGIL
jgi:hypothetical protein